MAITVGVLRGGPSREHEVSLKSGAAMLAGLPADKFNARDIYIDKTGQWHDRGRPVTPSRALRQIDVALIALHGEYGESGEVQQMLVLHGIPFAGADAFGTQQARHKAIGKALAVNAGVRTPAFRYVECRESAETAAQDATRAFHQPVVVKPVGWGSSVGVSIVGGYVAILAAVQALFDEGADGVLIEERIRGREATAGIIENFRNQALYALPVVEIVPPADDFFSYESKYSGASREICPGNFLPEETQALQEAAKTMHQALGQRHYSRSDFIVSPRGVYYLETNSAAAVGLTSESLLPKSLAAIGCKFPDFLSHLVTCAQA